MPQCAAHEGLTRDTVKLEHSHCAMADLNNMIDGNISLLIEADSF